MLTSPALVLASRCNSAEKLAPALADMLTDSAARRAQAEAFAGLDAIMATGHATPSMRAADIVLETMRKGRRAN